MTSYGVGVSNHFYLLDEDGLPEPAQPTKPVAPTTTSKKPTGASDRSQHRRGHRDADRRSGGPAGNRRGPKREFDRHSGTGRGFENKREGKGRYNWGAKVDENGEVSRPRGQGPRRRRPKDREEPTEQPTEQPAEQQQQQDADTEAAVEEAAAEPEEPVDSDAEKQDLSEYLKQMEGLRVDDDANLSIRQAVDDDDDEQFKATAAFTRRADSENEDPLLAGSASKSSRKNKKKASKKKPVISLDEFTKGQRQRRNYRHQGSGYHHRRAANEAGASTAVDIDDQSAFPALISAQ